MSLLITGAEGFVGKNLAEMFRLERSDVLAPTRAELDLIDEQAVASYFKANRIETIVHCATTLRDGTSYPPNTCENNLRMFFGIHRQLRPGMKLINLGSGSEYTRKYWHRKMKEEFFGEHVPDDGHSYAKYLISTFIRETNDPRLTSLRIFGIFGKYEDYRYKFISNAVVKNILGLPIIINQNVVYDYLDVADFYRIVRRLVECQPRYREYNVTPTDSIDLVTIANIVNQVGDCPSEIKVLNGGIGVEYSGDNRRLMEELGQDFRFTPPEVSITELRSHYLAQKDALDVKAIMQDEFLSYAKNLHEKFFKK